MRDCTNCGSSTDNPKFCGRACSATYHNRVKPKRARSQVYEKYCMQCQIERRSDIPGKYCSQTCAILGRKAEIVSNWLNETVFPTWIAEGHPIREYIYAEQENICALCPQGREWNGSPLNFILDHIDGNSYDSRRNNLRLVCPNCDFQLPTSKGRNRGNGRHSRRERYALGLSR
mgnify:FL=1